MTHSQGGKVPATASPLFAGWWNSTSAMLPVRGCDVGGIYVIYVLDSVMFIIENGGTELCTS